MIGSTFYVKSISFDKKNQLWSVEMILSSDEQNELKQVLVFMKQQTGNGPTNLRILANYLSDIGKFDLAEQYLERLLKQVSSNDPILGDLYEDLAKVASRSGNFDRSMKYHQKSIELKEKNRSSSTIYKGKKKNKFK